MQLTLNNVRLSYPHLWKPKAYKNGKGDPKYSATFIIDPDKNADALDDLEDAIEELIEEAFKGRKPKGMRVIIKEGNDKVNEDDEISEGYEDMVYIKASSKKRIAVVDTDPTVLLTEDDDKVRGGCYVNACVRLYAQDNDYGRHINVQLQTIQYVSKGVPFGHADTDPTKVFKKIKGERGAGRRSRDDDDEDEDDRPRRSRRRRDDNDDDGYEPARTRRRRSGGEDML